MIALSRSGRRVIYADGTFSLGYLTFPLLAGKLDLFSIIRFCPSNPDREITTGIKYRRRIYIYITKPLTAYNISDSCI